MKKLIITLAECEVKDSRRSECPNVAFFGTRLGTQSPWVFGLNLLFDDKRVEITLGYLEITSRSLIYSYNLFVKKELLFWVAQGLNRLMCNPSDQTLS